MPSIISNVYIELILTGTLLGWSVAWPPGPVNMEIVRRGSTSGFWSGFSICIGAVMGDALWAILVFSGTGLLGQMIVANNYLRIASLILLSGLATHYIYSSYKDMCRWKDGQYRIISDQIESSHTGLILGFFLTLTSPWSIAFWVGVSGILTISMRTPSHQVTLICSVIVGALAWGLLLCLATQPLTPLLKRTSWHAVAKLMTAVFLGIVVLGQVQTIN